MRALLGAPVSRDGGAVPRQAHNLKVARATRAPASSFGRGKAKGYFTWKRKTPGRLFPAPVWQWCRTQLLRFDRERSQVRVLPRTPSVVRVAQWVEH